MRYIKINSADNVAVAIQDLLKGEEFQVGNVAVRLIEDVPAGHKFTLKAIKEQDNVIKYGYPIGYAKSSLQPGEWVNEHKIATNLQGKLTYTYLPSLSQKQLRQSKDTLTFKGYKRTNGEVGIRNEIWVIPTVGCVNGTVSFLAEQLRRETNLQNVDAIVAYPHNYGCSQLGADHENTRKILRDMVLHPNVGGVLVVGLGCENNQIDAFKTLLGDIDESRVKFLETQKVTDEYEVGLDLLRDIYSVVSKDRREEVSISELKIGLKCGGSDGFSGITANPLLGAYSDFIIAEGGSAVLTEVPEMFGAETILMNRAVSKEIFEKTVHLINDFKDYFIANKQPIYENPSPGNKAGGISTLEEKSLGCTQKCGSAPVSDVLMYGERLKTKGLNLLSAPGNDLVASTALAASGCHLVLFTTGRGTPFGTFVPTVKIATNSALYKRKPGWIDFNAGSIVEGETIESLNEKFIDYLLRVINGEFVNNESKGYREIAIFKSGVTL